MLGFARLKSRLTHALTHTGIVLESTGQAPIGTCPVFCAFFFVYAAHFWKDVYMACVMKLPILWAASSCIWRVAWA